MICFYKDILGRIKFGDYEVPPTLNEYTIINDIPNKTYGKLNSAQLERYYEEVEYNRDPKYVIEGIEPEPYVPTLDDLKNDKKNELSSNYKSKIDEGFTYTLNSTECVFNLDENTMENILRQRVDWDFQKEQSDYDSELQFFAVTDRTKVQRIFNVTQFSEFGALFGRRLKGLQVLYAAKRNDIENAEDESALNDVDITFPQ
jgi:hypothetical protein